VRSGAELERRACRSVHRTEFYVSLYSEFRRECLFADRVCAFTLSNVTAVGVR
jgi:hypothetical protein